MWYVILTVIGIVVGFVLGMAVYRNNAKKFEKLEADMKQKAASVATNVAAKA